jgi:hypothetical protein
MGDPHPTLKGTLIDQFNAKHRGNRCPFSENDSLADSLHLGTTRVWNADGTVNEDAWRKLLDVASEDNQSIVRADKLFAYLEQSAEHDPEQPGTGRQSFDPLISKRIQVKAASLAWGTTIERLTCGYKFDAGANQFVPYISVKVMREFFDDSPIAYLRAESGLLPVPKPN